MSAPPNEKMLETGYEQFSRNYDPRRGRFRRRTEISTPGRRSTFSSAFLTATAPLPPSGKRALEMALFTLRKMAEGGMHDQLGGGFHRYSVDARWLVPHFEKMLYDQAQLASAYLTAFRSRMRRSLKRSARDTLDYVRRDMTSPEGGFFSAEDADSLPNEKSTEKVEGAFYVWTKDEIDRALGAEAAIFDFRYGVEAGGNIPEGSDPHGELRGKNILHERHTLAGDRATFRENRSRDSRLVRQEFRETSRAPQQQRPRPHLDDKIITAWNGLMISAFARAAQVLGDDSYLAAATRAAEFVRQKLSSGFRETLCAAAIAMDRRKFPVLPTTTPSTFKGCSISTRLPSTCNGCSSRRNCRQRRTAFSGTKSRAAISRARARTRAFSCG